MKIYFVSTLTSKETGETRRRTELFDLDEEFAKTLKDMWFIMSYRPRMTLGHVIRLFPRSIQERDYYQPTRERLVGKYFGFTLRSVILGAAGPSSVHLTREVREFPDGWK